MLDERLLREAEERFGVPKEIDLEAVIDEPELEMVAGSLRRYRTHDLTLFILHGPLVAVISKPFFPPGVYRAPSGGLHPGETVEEAALREMLEETGLTISLHRYLLRICATFYPTHDWPGFADIPAEVAHPDDPFAIRWWTHVFSAGVEGEPRLAPRDRREIAEARWVTLEELQGPIRQALLATGRGLFRYRVALTDAVVGILRESKMHHPASNHQG